jgi:hypothetical protein
VTPTLVVPRRFCGPPVSGNGGWSSGALATLVAGAPVDHATAWPVIEVSLSAPPPLDTELEVALVDGATVASREGTLIGSARVVGTALSPVDLVGVDEVTAATAAFPGWETHAFDTCFTCGTRREEGDGLRIFPGPTPADPETFAAPWVPHPSTAEDWWFLRSERSERLEGHAYVDGDQLASVAVTWAALDCPGGWVGGFATRPMVLARMTARLDALPVVGTPHVVMARHLETTGRKTTTATSLYDADGRLVGTSEQLWIAVDPALFR